MGWVKRFPLITFFILSYLITWPAWILESRGLTWMSFPGYFGPAIAALLMIAITQRETGLKDLFTRLFRWRVPFRWYLIATTLPLFSILMVVGFQIMSGNGSSIPFQRWIANLPQLALMGLGLSLYGTLVAAGEEIGWRGFALPELLKRHNPLVATLIIGIFWGLWHLPLRWLSPSSGNFTDALLYGMGFNAAAGIYTWLHFNTRGSLLIASLFHAVYDVTVILSSSLLGDFFSFQAHMIVLILIALVVIIFSQILENQKNFF